MYRLGQCNYLAELCIMQRHEAQTQPRSQFLPTWERISKNTAVNEERVDVFEAKIKKCKCWQLLGIEPRTPGLCILTCTVHFPLFWPQKHLISLYYGAGVLSIKTAVDGKLGGTWE